MFSIFYFFFFCELVFFSQFEQSNTNRSHFSTFHSFKMTSSSIFASAIIMLMALLNCLCSVDGLTLPIPPVVPPFESFQWEEYGSFLGNGTYNFYEVYPGNVSIGSNNGLLALDTVHSRYFLQITPPAAGLPRGVFQLGLPNGTYLTEANGVCYFNPNATYAEFLRTYSVALSRNPGDFLLGMKNYVGLINDPATCSTQAAVSIRRASTGIYRGVIFEYNADSLANFAFGSCFAGKIAASLEFTQWTWGVPAASNFEIPVACYNPLDYCSNFQPAGCNLVTPF